MSEMLSAFPCVLCGVTAYSCLLSLGSLHWWAQQTNNIMFPLLLSNLLRTFTHMWSRKTANTPTHPNLQYFSYRHIRYIILETGIALCVCVCVQTWAPLQLPFFCLSQAKPSKCHSRLCSMCLAAKHWSTIGPVSLMCFRPSLHAFPGEAGGNAVLTLLSV